MTSDETSFSSDEERDVRIRRQADEPVVVTDQIKGEGSRWSVRQSTLCSPRRYRLTHLDSRHVTATADPAGDGSFVGLDR